MSSKTHNRFKHRHFGDLIQANKHEKDKKIAQAMIIAIGIFPKSIINIASCFNENLNSDSDNMEYMMTARGQWTKTSEVTVKQLQVILKNALGKIEPLKEAEKLKIESFENENIIKFRQLCKNPNMRNIYFRLIHNDFFTHVRMKKYKITETDECPRCGGSEDMRRLLWDCTHASHIWSIYNNIMNKVNHRRTENFKDVFIPGDNQPTCIIKIKLIQQLIQIDRPKNWNEEKLKKIIEQTMSTDLYNATKNEAMLIKHKARWKNFKSWINTDNELS